MSEKISIKYIRDLVAANLGNTEDLRQAKRVLAKKHRTTILLNSIILKKYRQFYKGKIDGDLARLLRKREIRTLSGIAPVTVLTKPYPCPGQCVYCPSAKGMPKSYLASEPAAQRAWLLKFDPYKQVKTRIATLEANGHSAEKIELIVLGGTWSFYPKKYREWFITRCFQAANGSLRTTRPLRIAKQGGRADYSLQQVQKINETVKHRVIGLSLETRPDHVTADELWHMRQLGCTHVQIGVQTLHQDILDLIKRDDTLDNIARATSLLRDFGFKITYHLMPGLPGATPKKDLETFKKVFSDPRFQPDMLKIYPCLVVKNSLLYRWYKAGKYKPYNDQTLVDLLVKIKKIVPPYVRINRLIRDIPGPDIVAGNLVTNLRQLLHERGVQCQCIRCREVRGEKFSEKEVRLVKRVYQAGQGQECFLSFESQDRKKLYAFVRLRLPFRKRQESDDWPLDNETAVIRELHTYGELMPIGGRQKAVQHVGLGKRLMLEAEKLARKNRYKKIAVISGVGVREYYRKMGYELEKTYMLKKA